MPIQQMIMLENDDTSFTLEDTLYLCEKLGLPLIFDYHHHLAHHRNENWQESWERVVATWNTLLFQLRCIFPVRKVKTNSVTIRIM